MRISGEATNNGPTNLCISREWIVCNGRSRV